MKNSPAFHRLSLLIGDKAEAALGETKVIVFGLGGVGSWCAEALVRSGLGNITLVDHDTVDITNINRQSQAVTGTIGQLKTDALSARLKEINPDCAIASIPEYFSCPKDCREKIAQRFGIPGTDYIIDAIDSIESKLDLIECAGHFGVTIFSSMGMALKLDPTRLRTASIWKTAGCVLARHVREGLRKRKFDGDFTVVFSDEKSGPKKPAQDMGTINETVPPGQKRSIGSAVTVTAAAGMILASLVINDIYGKSNLE